MILRGIFVMFDGDGAVAVGGMYERGRKWENENDSCCP